MNIYIYIYTQYIYMCDCIYIYICEYIYIYTYKYNYIYIYLHTCQRFTYIYCCYVCHHLMLPATRCFPPSATWRGISGALLPGGIWGLKKHNGRSGECVPRLPQITIFNGKITMFNGKTHYFYGHFQ
jgi:hypothetical protein